ncbi:vWA domain-containing protein [Rufibacter roseus]|uniref:VWA domain-containing protein n=1 Tax=Rufibacter roseus TaxID=1567108 RepID=A0ABW2DM75_9BACT|nr:VWA domain-containing protein [Rufibacter roseus]
MKLVRAAAFLVCCFLLLGATLPTIAQGTKNSASGTASTPATKTRLLFLLDASGSMFAKWENSDRWTIAKYMLSRMADSLEAYPNLEVALRVYGHQSMANERNCKDTKLEVPFGKKNALAIRRKLQQIVPKGNTPITYSLEQSGNDFPQEPNVRNVIIIITDGLESCGGDPCATSLALQKKNVFLKPFIIGLGEDPGYQQQFGCMGTYYNASDVKTFYNIMDNVINLALKKTTVSVVLTDDAGRAVESNVNMTFVNSLSQLPEYNLIHYMDEKGKPDVLEIDALRTYDLVVNTVPAVTMRQLHIEPGKHNVIKVKSPQGYIYLKQDAPTYYGKLQALVRQRGQKEILNVQTFTSQRKYLTGQYEIELLTMPRITRYVTIQQGLASTVTFDPPGLLNITQDFKGYGSIYEIGDDGVQNWIYNIPEGSSKISLPLQPGHYRVVYRMRSALSSKFTYVKTFKISSNQTTTVKLFD